MAAELNNDSPPSPLPPAIMKVETTTQGPGGCSQGCKVLSPDDDIQLPLFRLLQPQLNQQWHIRLFLKCLFFQLPSLPQPSKNSPDLQNLDYRRKVVRLLKLYK